MGGGSSVLKLIEDDSVAVGAAWLPSGVAASSGLGAAGADIALAAVADSDSSAVG